MERLDDLLEALKSVGAERYGNENVSQLAHALQCAKLAEDDGSGPELIAASLLHDIGHVIDSKFETGQVNDVDRQHERIGAAYLSDLFGHAVTEPIRLHVDAKRYLCRIDPAYFDGLSDSSVRSLRLQGGPMTAEEADAFISRPYAPQAVKLRRWDDLAKVPNQTTPDLDHFAAYVREAHVTVTV